MNLLEVVLFLPLAGFLCALLVPRSSPGASRWWALAVSLADDEGASWKWTRHLQRREPGQGSFHYPSIIQGREGEIHVTFTHHVPGQGSTIMYARFNEAWISSGDEK